MIKNASQLPKRYFGRHFSAGVAEYREPKKDPYCIFINEATAKQMDATFDGKPLYVQHVNDVDVENLQLEADGYVLKSFYNAADGMHWAEFLVVSDKGHEAISKGWKLSNAYVPKETKAGGEWHGVKYVKEITQGEYDHLAIVNDPRYAESVILTPEEFKAYNEKKDFELKRLSNSKDKENKTVGLLKLFKKEKIENSLDLENTMVALPESKKEVSLTEAVEMADKFCNMHGYANEDHMVRVGDDGGEMSVKDMCNAFKKMKKNEEDAKAKEDEEKKKNDKDAEEKANVDKLKNAKGKAVDTAPIAEISSDKIARGKARYGSN